MDFKNIPKKYRPIPFWSWNDKLEVEETVRQIEMMDEQGIGGFFMHARSGLQTEYMGEEWFKNVQACVDKCKENGMYPYAYDENGWPSGFGNGKVNGKGVEYQQKYLKFEKGERNTPETICNSDGDHFYYEVNPYYVDTLDAKVVKCFIEESYQPYYDKVKGKIEGIFTDEPQVTRDGIPWSFVMPDEYKKAYGEDLYEILPQLFFDIGDYKESRVKFWKLVTNLFSKNYMKQIYDWCEEHGVKFTGHLVEEDTMYKQITTNGACMPHYEYMHIPGMDWLGRHNNETLTYYQVASTAQQTGKKQVLSETFAMCGHNVGNDELKWIYEYLMVRGVNLLCQHLQGYSNKGIRKRDYPPAMYIQQPWWNDYKQFNDAMSRIGMLLSNGEDCTDVLVIHPITTAWTMYNGNDEGKKKIREYDQYMREHSKTLEMKHINFHFGDEIIIERHGSVEGNRLVIGEKKYSKVIIPEHDVLFENTKKLLEEYKNNGGIITTAEEIGYNDIIDIPEITYCKRKFDDFDMYYFVNSTDKTFKANIKLGNKVMDIVSGELKDFDGTHMFRKYESLVVIDDSNERICKSEKRLLNPLDLSGEWNLVKSTKNSIMLDKCEYWFDDEFQGTDTDVLTITNRAVELKRPVKVDMIFNVDVECLPEEIHFACETPELFEIRVNEKLIEYNDCGYFIDKSLRKMQINNLKIGINEIKVSTLFSQSKQVYENIEKAKKFETEKNKLVFDMEIEPMYLIGDFSVKTEGEYEELERDACRYKGNFVIGKLPKKITLNDINKQGFPFFSGSITVSKKFEIEDKNVKLDFEKTGINVVKATINGKKLPVLMWEPYSVDLSSIVKEGTNTLELILVNNLRNILGLHHRAEGECYSASPGKFYREKCVWSLDAKEEEWNNDYCFINLSLRNRKQEEL